MEIPLLLLLCSCAAASTRVQTLSIPTPSNAPAVPADFVGFGFETAFLNDYANPFSENLVASVARRSAKPPVVRVGGTSGDEVLFDAGQQAVKVCIKGECPLGSSAQFILGPSYFDGFARFPSARMSFQAPLGPVVNTSGSLEYVRRAYAAVGSDRVAAIALGNEPNFYDSAQKYSDDAKRLAAAIVKDLDLKDKRVFEAVDLAQAAALNDKAWSIQDAFEAGLDSNKSIRLAAGHYYQVTGKEGFDKLQATLMNHTAITSRLASYVESARYLADKHPDVPLVFSETASSIGSHPLNYTNAFGSTLWSAAFQLAAMSRGIARVSMTQRPVAKHSLWVPDNSVADHGMPGPSVRAPFSAQPFVTDFVGSGVSVAEVSSGDDPFTAAYAAFGSGGRLERIAIVNLRLWYDGSGPRSATRFDVHLGAGTQVTASRLRAEAGATAMGLDIGGPGENITWAGEQWSYKVDKGKGHAVGSAKETLNVRDGVVAVTVPDSEAVILYVG